MHDDGGMDQEKIGRREGNISAFHSVSVDRDQPSAFLVFI